MAGAAKLHRHVIAVGGGALINEENARVIKEHGIVVLLVCDLTVLAARIARHSHRPSLTGQGPAEAEIAQVWEERRKRYHAVADLTYDVSAQSRSERGRPAPQGRSHSSSAAANGSFYSRVGVTTKGLRMIVEALHNVFVVLKWLFGFGALMTLLGIGLALLWFAARAIVVRVLRNQAADRFPVLRKLFLEMLVP